jgi:hypothetical protein
VGLLGPNADGELPQPGRVPDCYLGLRLDPPATETPELGQAGGSCSPCLRWAAERPIRWVTLRDKGKPGETRGRKATGLPRRPATRQPGCRTEGAPAFHEPRAGRRP